MRSQQGLVDMHPPSRGHGPNADRRDSLVLLQEKGIFAGAAPTLLGG